MTYVKEDIARFISIFYGFITGVIMAENESKPAETSIRIPAIQRLLDNPFLLLFLGVATPTVLYIVWGVMELSQIPIAE